MYCIVLAMSLVHKGSLLLLFYCIIGSLLLLFYYYSIVLY